MKHMSIIKPLRTEKTLQLASDRWYTFAVRLWATKRQIVEDVASVYKVKAKEVRTIVMRGKTRRVGKRGMVIRTREHKKALVKVGAGQTIDAFEVAPTQQAKKA